MSALLHWYFQDHWFNGFVCGMWFMMIGRWVADAIWPPKRPQLKPGPKSG